MHLKGEIVDINTIGIEELFVIDSLFIVTHSRDSTFITIYKSDNLKKIGTYIQKGRGPDEFFNFIYDNQFYYDSCGVSLYFSDMNKREIYTLRLNNLINNLGNPIKKIASTPGVGLPTFVLGENRYLSKIYDDPDFKVSYMIFDSTGNEVKDYPLYKNLGTSIRMNQIASSDVLNKDRSKVMMGMTLFNQINLINLETNEYKVITVSDDPLFISEKEVANRFVCYYSRLCTYNDLVFALYTNMGFREWGKNSKSRSNIHVFNWEGKPIAEIIVNEDLNYITTDSSKNKLYGITTDEIIYVYDLPQSIK